MQTYNKITWYTPEYVLGYPRAALSLLAVCHIGSSCSADKAAWFQYVSSDLKLMKEIPFSSLLQLIMKSFSPCPLSPPPTPPTAPASFLCPSNKDFRYEFLNGWKDPFSFFVQAIHNRCQQRYWKNSRYGHAFRWLGTCMQSVCNYNGKSWYLNTVLGTNYKLKLNRTILFILILRATPKCYLKDQGKNAKTNTVCKWVVGRCKGHVYPSCSEGPSYSIH